MRVEWPTVRALVAARLREIAWSPLRQLISVLIMTPGALFGAISTGIVESTIVWLKVVYFVSAFQLGTLIGAAASPTGRDIFDLMFDFTKKRSAGHVMAQLPASALERLAATSLLALPLAFPYIAGTLLLALLPRNSGFSAAQHLALLALGFGTQRAWTHFDRGRASGWMMRQRWSVPVYGSPRGGEVRAAFWAVAPQSVFVPFVAPAIALAIGALIPDIVSHLGAERVALSLAGIASYSVWMGLVMYAWFLPALAAAPLSKRSFAAAVLLLLLVLSVFSGLAVLGLFVVYYRSTEGVEAGAQLSMTLTGFEALAGAAVARFVAPKNVAPIAVIISVPLMATMMATGFVAALIPSLMPFVGAVAAVAFALALLLAFTAPRAPLSREPAGVIGAALRLLGAA